MSLGMDLSSAYRKLRRRQEIDFGPVNADWTPVPGCPGYEAASCGLVRRVAAGRGAHLGVLPADNHHKGYVRHGVVVGGRVRPRLAHDLIARTFLGQPAPGLVVNHKNSVRHDNRVENLEWVTAQGNVQHAWKAGRGVPMRGELNGEAILTEEDVRAIRMSNESGPMLGARYGVTKEQINNVKRRKAWKHIL